MITWIDAIWHYTNDVTIIIQYLNNKHGEYATTTNKHSNFKTVDTQVSMGCLECKMLKQKLNKFEFQNE